MLLKILYELWPFIKEIFAGESDLSKAIRRNKLSALLFIVNVSMFGLLMYITDQMITKQRESKATIEEVYKLRTQLQECEHKTTPTKPVVIKTPVQSKQTQPEPKPDPVPPIDLNSKLDALRREENTP